MILVAGENLIDMIQTDAEGEAPAFRASVGGSPYNCARALGRLGAAAGYLTPISTDRMGERLAAAMAADGVALLGGRSPRPTAMALVTLEDGQPHYQFYREGVADRDVTPAGLRGAMPEGARALHLGSLALLDGPDAEALAALAEEAAAGGLTVSVDPNIRPMVPGSDAPAYRDRLARVLSHADVIKLSDEDLDWFDPAAATDPEGAAAALVARFRPGLLVLTRGAKGAIAFHGGTRLTVPAAPLPRLVDAVGAGDTFMAALLDGLGRAGALDRAALAAMPVATLRAMLERAARAAAVTCSRAGCNPPSAAELDG